MSSVTIGGEKRPLDKASPSWITEQIERRRRDGIAVCVMVDIKISGLDFRLATPECSRTGGGRLPKANEKPILDLWEKCGLNEAGFAPGRVVEFLTRLRRLL